MDKKLTVIEVMKLLGVSKEAIYNRLRRGSLQSVVENGVKYILLTKSSLKEGPSARKLESATDSACVELLKVQLEEMKLKNEKLESDKERLIADKERLLIESKEKIEMIYKERDEQLKAILTLANRQITHTGSETVTANTAATNIPTPTSSTETPFFLKKPMFWMKKRRIGLLKMLCLSRTVIGEICAVTLRKKDFLKREAAYQ